jgi:hypothetical protein
VGLLYLYSCSQNSNVIQLQDTINSLTEEITYLTEQLDKNEKRYIKSLEELEQVYEVKIKQLKTDSNLPNDLKEEIEDEFANSLIEVIKSESLNYEEKVNECKTLIDLKHYIIE